MKKIIAILLLLLIPVYASAAPKGNAPSIGGNSIQMTILGEAIVLDFDSDPQYSYCENGIVQASFFAYDKDATLYELYICFPIDTAAGETVSQQSSTANNQLNCGISLFITDATTEVFAAAAQDAAGAFPVGSEYAIQFDRVEVNGANTTYAGQLDAVLVAIDVNSNPLYPIDVADASFSFTISTEAAPAVPSVPSQTPGKGAPPTIVMPPDAKKI